MELQLINNCQNKCNNECNKCFKPKSLVGGIEELLYDNPAELVALLSTDELSLMKLSYAAEIAGNNLPYEMVVEPLLKLLDHQSSIVREGAVYGLQCHKGDVIDDRLRSVADNDKDLIVRVYAKNVLSMRLSAGCPDFDAEFPTYNSI